LIKISPANRNGLCEVSGLESIVVNGFEKRCIFTINMPKMANPLSVSSNSIRWFGAVGWANVFKVNLSVLVGFKRNQTA